MMIELKREIKCVPLRFVDLLDAASWFSSVALIMPLTATTPEWRDLGVRLVSSTHGQTPLTS
jgi:hypothetical protein